MSLYLVRGCQPKKVGKVCKCCGDFSSDIDYHSKTDIFRVICLIINQCEPRRPKASSGGHCVRQPRSGRKQVKRACPYY